jgi:5'-nucleotidase (lipoprotein e(P4) family)
MRTALLLLGFLPASLAFGEAFPPSLEQLNAVAWVQAAPEYAANTQSIYRSAAAQLKALKRKRSTASTEQAASGASFSRKPRAIVLDVDETVLNNSAYNALLVRDRRLFDADGYRWTEFVLAGIATEVAGATEFAREARAAGYHLFFVTNRACNEKGAYDAQGRSIDCPQKAATLDNLARVLGYRPAGEDLLVRYERKDRDDSSKKARRAQVAERYRIAMLLGDDLGDFVKVDEYQPATHAVHWGRDWFALPNPMYGSWERRRTPEQKAADLEVWERPHMKPH